MVLLTYGSKCLISHEHTTTLANRAVLTAITLPNMSACASLEIAISDCVRATMIIAGQY